MSIETQQQQGDVDVVAWRRTQLVRSGFSPLLASRVACDQRYDVHALIELVEHGCEVELAVRILAPLEEQGAA
jgi:hypothetical protein